MDKQYFQKQLKKLMIDENINQKKLGELTGTTQQVAGRKILNFSWRYIDLVNLLDELGYDVVWVKRDENSQTKQ